MLQGTLVLWNLSPLNDMTCSCISTLFCLVPCSMVLEEKIPCNRNLDLETYTQSPRGSKQSMQSASCIAFPTLSVSWKVDPPQNSKFTKMRRKLHIITSSLADFLLLTQKVRTLEFRDSELTVAYFFFVPVVILFIVNKKVALHQEAPGFDPSLSGSQRKNQRKISFGRCSLLSRYSNSLAIMPLIKHLLFFIFLQFPISFPCLFQL